MDYLQKYQKYKAKYNNLKLQNQYGGNGRVFKIFFLTYTEYNEYISKNNQLDTGIVDIRSDIVTADRKTFYETQNYDNLMKWYRIFKWIYILLLLAFFIGLFITKSDMSRTVKISAFIFLIIYPIVINYLVDFIIKSLKNAYNLMPKNIYKSL